MTDSLQDTAAPEVLQWLETGVLQAPSAHNTQSCRLEPISSTSFRLVHLGGIHAPKPATLTTPLNAGVFVENAAMTAPNFGLHVEFTPTLETTDDSGMQIGTVDVSEAQSHHLVDPLSEHASKRHTNRNAYTDAAVDEDIERRLTGLGNVITTSAALHDLVLEAGNATWADGEIIRDLNEWIRESDDAPDGITPGAFGINAFARLSVEKALRKDGLNLSSFRHTLARFVEGDVFATAPTAAVLGADSLDPVDVFDAGRRLLRSWVEVAAAGYDYHPHSGPVFIESVRPKVAERTGLEHPVAVTRIGTAEAPPKARSNRRPLEDFIINNS